MSQRPSKLRDAGFTGLAAKLDKMAEKQLKQKVVVKTVKGELSIVEERVPVRLGGGNPPPGRPWCTLP